MDAGSNGQQLTPVLQSDSAVQQQQCCGAAAVVQSSCSDVEKQQLAQ